MLPTPPRRRPARPVADAPVAELAARAEDLAKGWLMALVEQEPLARAASIATGELTDTGPRICAALAHALTSDAELARIAPGGELEALVARTAELAGAQTAEEASRAVDALRAVLWSAALSALGNQDGSLVAELAERLAVVSELTRGAALRRLAGPAGPALPDAIAAAVARTRRDGAALSLLLVELDDTGRVLAVEPEEDAAVVFGRLVGAVRGAVGAGDQVIGEGAGRAWVIAPGADRRDAERLGAVLAAAVRAAGSWRGAPLRASVGVATLDHDAAD
ncbi:MAG TPA: hypothetical protein VMP89_01930, partial [Solirubrobacteraceae bacterium]|nr:hypothetical protein [Solirubrobacteraceae bacterium]